LKEKYDYTTNSNYPTGCPLFETASEAEASKRQLETQGQRAKKQIVEVDWKPGSGVDVLQGTQGHNLTAMPRAPARPTHTFCAAGYEGTMYFSARVRHTWPVEI
jgi:hypothetical protein